MPLSNFPECPQDTSLKSKLSNSRVLNLSSKLLNSSDLSLLEKGLNFIPIYKSNFWSYEANLLM